MFSCKQKFFYKTGFHLSGKKSLDVNVNVYNLIFYLGKRKNIFIIKFTNFLYNFRISLFFLYRIISLRGKVLAFDERFYIRRCLVFFLNRANQHYLTKHWIGGTLTNFKNFQLFFYQIVKGFLSVKKYYDFFIYFFGLKRMQQIPSLLILTNPNNSIVALQEGARLSLPILSLVNVNTENTLGINFPIPCNNIDFKSLYVFYTIVGDAMLYGWLRPVSFYFKKFFRRLKFFRKIDLIKKSYNFLYHNFEFLKAKHFIWKFDLFLNKFGLLFFKNKNFLNYFEKKTRFIFKTTVIDSNLKILKKKFFKNSFFKLWFLKKIFKFKKKKRRKLYKKLFKYRRRHRIKRKRFKILRFFKFKVRIFIKKFKKLKKRSFIKSFYYKSLIRYNFYKIFYKRKKFLNLLKKIKYEEEHVEDILNEFDELPEERKQKMLKKLNESFSVLNPDHIKSEKKDKNFLKISKFLFTKKFNLHIFKFCRIFKKINLKILKLNNIFYFPTYNNKNLSNIKFNKKKNYLKVFQQRRKYFFNYRKSQKTNSVYSNKYLNVLYLKLLND